ncbi:hypothetical protein DRN85_07655 [Methanosarcinales archaeon]|nr:MAG: hypothetical protein DRN85_07655 [Methanosarcinales archaeon]
MVFGLPLGFANTMGLLALFSIVPLVILYLLRPKPVVLKIPSIMFLFDFEDEKKRFSTIRRFVKDPLFLIQLLVLLLLALAVGEPFVLGDEEVGGGHTVIVFDVSASMQSDGRFDSAKEEAERFLSKKNTIILAGSIPVVVLRESPKESASSALLDLSPRAGEADLSRAILLGMRYLGEGGRIVVISDFAHFIGDDPLVAAGIARGSGIDVELVRVTGGDENVGIVDGWFEGTGYNLLIHNYNPRSEKITLSVTAGGSTLLEETRVIGAGSSEPFLIRDLPQGRTVVSIAEEDSLMVDNTIHVVIPASLEKRVLHLSNGSPPSLVALRLLEPVVTTDQVPVGFAGGSEGYAITVLSEPESGSLDGFDDYVKSGGVLVVLASEGLSNSDLLPVTIKGVANRTTLNILTSNVLSENFNPDIEITRHLVASEKPGSVVLAEAGDGSVILAHWMIGRGRVIYLGLAEPKGDLYDPLNPEAWNSFHATPTYPLFWQNLVEWSAGSIDVNEFNLRAGAVREYPQPITVKTPTIEVTAETVLFDEVGIYETPAGEIAVNLLNQDESDITRSTNMTIEETRVSYALAVTEVARNLDRYFIIAGLLFILLELYYLYWRGDLR